jgi:hypothetical protein
MLEVVAVMKNQYFGDTRDLFKYDLILEILLKSDSMDRFTLIPMLTPNELSRHGKRTNYSNAKAGTQRTELKDFLETCVRENRRNIRELERFFDNLAIYKKSEYFSHETRKGYFDEIPEDYLRRSVILVDPDIGLEVGSVRVKQEKYLRYEEVKSLYNRMDNLSVLTIFQFIPRVKRRVYFFRISRELKAKLSSRLPILYVSDNQIVFFLLTKNSQLQNSIENIIREYAKVYRLTFGRS